MIRRIMLAALAFAVMAVVGSPEAGGLSVAALQFADIASSEKSEVSETFKNVYALAVNTIPDRVALLTVMKRTRKWEPSGSGIEFFAELTQGAVVANVPDGRSLTAPSRPSGFKGKADVVHTYTSIAVGGQTPALTRNRRQAFANNLERQMEDAKKRAAQNLEIQYNGDGTGILAIFETVASAPVYDLHRPYGIAAALNPGPGTMLLTEGMHVAAINPGTGAERDRDVISDVDHDLEQITTAAAIAGAVIGDYLVLCQDATATGAEAINNYNNTADGVLGATNDTGAFQNLNPATSGQSRWKGVKVDLTGKDISERRIDNLKRRIRSRYGEKPDLVYLTDGLEEELKDQASAMRRSTETVSLPGDFEGIKIGRNMFLVGDYCPRGMAFAINTSEDALGYLDLEDGDFIDLDGSPFHRADRRHVWLSDLWIPHGAMWPARMAHGRLEGMNDDNALAPQN